MPHSSVAQRPSTPILTPWYPDDLLPELQYTLAALSNLKLRYETDCQQLQAWTGPKAVKKRFAAQLEERYHQEREPHVQRLADLHQQMMTIMALQDICRTA